MCARTHSKQHTCDNNFECTEGCNHSLKVKMIEENLVKNNSIKCEMDTLAVFTAYQKKAFDIAKIYYSAFQKSRYFKLLFATTQPAHIISIVTVCSVVSLLYSCPSRQSSFTMMLYLAAFSIQFGSQFWMTFVSGLSLYFTLSRHTFGSVQRILFPMYFGLNCFLSAITLVAFNKLDYPWNGGKIFQEVSLSICFLIQLVVRLYLVPPLLSIIIAKTEIEANVGMGQEVGFHDPGPLRHCPHYAAMHKSFRKAHLHVALGNIIAFVCTALHLQYLAQHWISHNKC